MNVSEHLLLSIRFHGGRERLATYHGVVDGHPEWPPSPARVFQALVAGGARGGGLPEPVVHALRWLERQPPPVIAAPAVRLGTRVTYYVPNNDADSVEDPRDVSGIRTQKSVQPFLIESQEPLLYAWSTDGDALADVIMDVADGIYQLGRGLDMAWALGERLGHEDLDRRLVDYRGIVHRPDAGDGGKTLACPSPGSLESLEARYRTKRFKTEGGKRLQFHNAPKPRFRNVAYERVASRALFELRDAREDETRIASWPLEGAVRLVESLRNGAAARLRAAFPDLDGPVEAALVGRTNESGPTGRVRIVPLPSIGHVHADRAIRRFVVETPSGGPLLARDVEWAFSGVTSAPLASSAPTVVAVAAPPGSDEMLRHYLGPARCWRSVTAVVLPESAKRRRLAPDRRREEAKGGKERCDEEASAASAVASALRHAGLRERLVAVRVQREPFDARGSRVEPFAEGTRFAKERLWHVELELERPVTGPLTIGDGRFLGLGVMAPVEESRAADAAPARAFSARTPAELRGGLFSLRIESGSAGPQVGLARALRRAVMACVQEEQGRGRLAEFFTGHDERGAKAAAANATHLAFHFDPVVRRLLVLAPHWLDRREPTWRERQATILLDRALDRLTVLRAGRAGLLQLVRTSLEADDLLLTTSRAWRSVTPYTVTRHAHGVTAPEAVAADLVLECSRRGLPRPRVSVLDTSGVPGRGLEGDVRLEFDAGIAGPLVLGRTRFLGGGLFRAEG